jgi:hypothetical protein
MKRIGKEVVGIVGIAILLVSGVAIFFASCEKEDLGEMKERGIAINFMLGTASYGENEVAVRSAKELASETVVVPMEGDIYMYATLAEDAMLRANTVSIAENTLVRIVAFDEDGDPVGNAVYKVKSNGTDIECVGMGLSVPAEGEYTFVAYSYNSTTVAPDYSATTLTVSPDYDLLWGSEVETVTEEGPNEVSIGMKHKFSQVTVEITTTAISDEPAITATYPTSITPGYRATLTVISGVMDKGSNFTPYLSSSWTGVGTSTVTSTPRCVYTAGDYPIFVEVSWVAIDGVTFMIPTPRFNMPLVSGSSYTLTVAFKKNLVWAGSNIYWDESLNSGAGGLTFDAPGASLANQMKQGVFFKWGSLVGISPAGDSNSAYDAATTKIYVPTYNSGTSSWDWEDPSSFHLDWEDIPYVDDIFTGAPSRIGSQLTNDALNTSNDYDYWKNRKGDICRFLTGRPDVPSGSWRMPTSLEQGMKSYYSYGNSDGWTREGGTSWNAINVPEAYVDGSYPISYGASNTGITFPASGRYYDLFSGGVMCLYSAGERGYLWSSSASGSDGGYNMDIYAGGVLIETSISRVDACPIRCVKN